MVRTSTSLTSEMKQLWRIGWPLLLAQAAQMGTGVVDTIMAARFGDKDLAAIAIGFHIWLPLYLIVLGMMFASSSIIAQDFGGGRIQRIRDQLPQSLWVAVLLSLLVAPVCYVSPVGLPYLGIDALTAQKSGEYIRMVAFGLPAIGIFMALRYHTQGIGITSPFAVAAVIGFFANIPLNYMLFLDLAIFQPWEPKAAASPRLSQCGYRPSSFRSTYSIKILKQYLPPWTPVAPDPTAIKSILVLGFPVGATMFLETAVFTGIALLVSSLVMLPLAPIKLPSTFGICSISQCSPLVVRWRRDGPCNWCSG